MTSRLAALIVDESKWLTVSMGVALIAIGVLVYQSRRSGPATLHMVLAAMSLFFAITIGTMALGHLLAVTTKLAMGSLVGSAPVFYAIGIALAAPAWWLAWHTPRVLASDDRHRRRTLMLNAWLGATLLALGLHNLPLAAPGFFNIGYLQHTRRSVGVVLVCLSVVVQFGLFIGSLVFLTSGQSFEQFSGIE